MDSNNCRVFSNHGRNNQPRYEQILRIHLLKFALHLEPTSDRYVAPNVCLLNIVADDRRICPAYNLRAYSIITSFIVLVALTSNTRPSTPVFV